MRRGSSPHYTRINKLCFSRSDPRQLGLLFVAPVLPLPPLLFSETKAKQRRRKRQYVRRSLAPTCPLPFGASPTSAAACYCCYEYGRIAIPYARDSEARKKSHELGQVRCCAGRCEKRGGAGGGRGKGMMDFDNDWDDRAPAGPGRVQSCFTAGVALIRIRLLARTGGVKSSHGASVGPFRAFQSLSEPSPTLHPAYVSPGSGVLTPLHLPVQAWVLSLSLACLRCDEHRNQSAAHCALGCCLLSRPLSPSRHPPSEPVPQQGRLASQPTHLNHNRSTCLCCACQILHHCFLLHGLIRTMVVPRLD